MKVNLLKAELVKQGKTVEWLADQLGYSRTNLYNKLNGKYEMTLRDAKIISKSLSMEDETATEIFFGE